MDLIPGDVFTEEIVKRLRHMNTKSISYSDIYDKFTDVCFNPVTFIDKQLDDKMSNIFTEINVLNNQFQGKLFLYLKDEIMMHFYYLKNSHSFTEPLETAINAHSERNAILKLFSKEFYKYRIPDLKYIKVIRKKAENNPYNLKKDKINYMDYINFVGELSKKIMSNQPPSKTLTIKREDERIDYYKFYLSHYYLEKCFKMSYFKRFAYEFHVCLEQFIKQQLDVYTSLEEEIRELDEYIRTNTVSQSNFISKYIGRKFDPLSVLEDAHKIFCDLQKKIPNDTYLSLEAKKAINKIDFSLNFIKQIITLIQVSDRKETKRRKEFLLKIAYDFAELKLDTTNPYMLEGGQLVWIDEQLQEYGNKRIFCEKEKASGLYRLGAIVSKLSEVIKNNKYDTHTKADIYSINTQRKFCSIICDTIKYCWTSIKIKVVDGTPSEYIANMIVDEEQIKILYKTLCYEYNKFTNAGSSIACRRFLNINYEFTPSLNCEGHMTLILKKILEDRGLDPTDNDIFIIPTVFSNPNRFYDLNNFIVLHDNIIKYLFAQIIAVKIHLESTNTSKVTSVKVQCDKEYMYSQDYINQLKIIEKDIEEYMNNKIQPPLFNFSKYKSINFSLSSAIIQRLQNLQTEYYNQFLTQLFKNITLK